MNLEDVLSLVRQLFTVSDEQAKAIKDLYKKQGTITGSQVATILEVDVDEFITTLEMVGC